MMAPERAPARRGWIDLLLAALILALAVLLVYWRLVLTNRVLAGGDALGYFIPYRDFANEALRSGRMPLWNPYLFLGVPFLANPQTAVLYPLHWPFVALPAAKSLLASFVLHGWLAGLGVYVYARRVPRLSFWPALAGGLIFCLAGFLGAHVAQVNQVSAAAWLPWLLWLLEEATGGVQRQASTADSGQPAAGQSSARTLNLVALAALAAAIALQFLAGHTQSSYINLVGLGVSAIWPGVAALLLWMGRRLRRGKRSEDPSLDRRMVREAGRRLLLLLGAVILGVLLAAVQLLPTWELSQQSVRSGGLPYREVVSFSLRPRTLLLSLLPSYGENLAGRFGTPAFAEFVAYVGVAALGLAALSLAAVGRKRTFDRFLPGPGGLALALAAVGLALALGLYNPLYFLLYKLVPGFDLFRVPARWLIFYTFGIAMLAAYGLDGAISPDRLAARALPAWRHWGRPARGTAIAGALLLLALLAFQYWPGLLTVAVWLLAALSLIGLLLLGRRRAMLGPLVAALLVVELTAASLALDHARPTAPEAVTSLRTAPAHLLAVNAEAEAAGAIPGRFLSLSNIAYDPGDLAEMVAVLDDQLPEQAVYDFVVASKLQEIVAPNLSLLWRLPAVDGYDGGVLPLRRYVDLQTLFVPADQLAADGRLREQLQGVPPSRLLRLLGVDHVITDKVFDVWWDGVYYDLELSTPLQAVGDAVAIDAADRLEATAVGVFTNLRHAARVPDGTPVAEVLVYDEGGEEAARFPLRAGMETAEGAWTEDAGHARPAAAQPWPRDQAGWDYLARVDLPAPLSPGQIVVRQVAPDVQTLVRGVSLIDARTGTHAALTVPADGSFRRVHSGDVKVYRDLAALPRAYVVSQALAVADDDEALAALADPAFDPRHMVVLPAGELAAAGLALPAAPASTGASPAVEVLDYRPERVALGATVAQPGFLVLSDTWYGGWQARVDGLPVPILRANLLFRAVALPAGSHEVVFEYRPAWLRTGALLSAAALVTLAALAVWGVAHRRRSNV